MSARETTLRPGLRDVFAGPGYRRLWSARTMSQWGDIFNFVALALLIYDLTGSGLGVSGVVVAEILPVLLLPGRGYTVNHPVLYYVGEVARELGWVVEVSWDGTDLSDREVIAHGRAALASLPATGSVVVGKSLGSLLLPDAVARNLPGVWLTPLLHRVPVRAGVLRGTGPSLLVGGTADESWDSATAHRSGHAVLELAGGDHGLQLAGDSVGSARFLVTLVEHTREFLAELD